VAQLLELVRTENVSPRMECIDLGRLVSGEALPFESVAFENGVTLESSVADGVQVSGNSAQLKQLISILLDNAIRHCRPSGTVGIVLAQGKNAAFLSVINDGLGLAIAKADVTAHRGRIEVLCHEAKVEFTVRIPLQK